MAFVMRNVRHPLALVRRIRDRRTPADRLWIEANAAIAMGRPQRAEEIHVSISSRKPASPTDCLFIGLALYRLGQSERAIEVLEAGYNRFPTETLLADNFLRVGLELGQHERITKTLGPTAGQMSVERLARELNDWHDQVSLIGYCLRAGLPTLADDLIAAVVRACDDIIELWRLSDELLATGRRGEAEDIYRRLSRRPPDSPEAFLYSALSFERLQRLIEAVDLLEVGVRRYPTADYLVEHQIRICLASDQIGKIIGPVGAEAVSDSAICEALFDRFPDPAFRVSLVQYAIRKKQFAVAKRKLLDGGRTDSSSDLWTIAEHMTNHGYAVEAGDIYRALLAVERRTAWDSYFAALSALRLGDEDRCLTLLEEGQESYRGAAELRDVYLQVCAIHLQYDRYSAFVRRAAAPAGSEVYSIVEFYKKAAEQSPETFILNYQDLEPRCSVKEFSTLKRAVLASLKRAPFTHNKATVLLFFARYLGLDDDFTLRLWELFRDHGRASAATSPSAAEKEERALELAYRLTIPMIPAEAGKFERELDEFIRATAYLTRTPVELNTPIGDMTNSWTPWQYIFCNGDLHRYNSAVSAFEQIAFKTWPKLNYRASHVSGGDDEPARPARRVRVGFIVHDSMPMMSGLLSSLDRNVFETVFLRPGAAGQTSAAKTWIERAERTVEFSDVDAYDAIEAIAREQLDIIVSGPSVASIFFPMMARLAPLQMVLLEPNWTDGLTNADYYISWRPAEPDRPADYYRTAVAFLEHPPYWIERPRFEEADSEAAKVEVRQRLLGAGPDDRIYLCANTPPKIHPDMDGMFLSLLEQDPQAKLVTLRSEYPPAKTLKSRLSRRFGAYRNRLIVLPTLKQRDAHRLLQSVDCCLDSFPICGMSSSFDAAMLGVPLVTLPSEMPFGKWTATIYDYIGVSGLTAMDEAEYLAIARRLAKDRPWRDRLGAEIRERSSRFVESAASANEFQEFITRAWSRHRAGLPPANWIGGAWPESDTSMSRPQQVATSDAI